VRVSPRALLYVCDQPEERAIMCLEESGCLFPCTPCTVEREISCTEGGMSAPPRDVGDTVRAQLRIHGRLPRCCGIALPGGDGAQPEQYGSCSGGVGWAWQRPAHAVSLARI